MPNPLYIYIYIYIEYIYDLYTNFIDNILKWAWDLFCTQLNIFRELLYNSHNLISIICLQTVCNIQPIDRTLSGVITLGRSGPESNGNEGILSIPGASSSDSLMSCWGHSFGVVSYFYLKIQSVYYTVPFDWNTNLEHVDSLLYSELRLSAKKDVGMTQKWICLWGFWASGSGEYHFYCSYS